VGTDRVPRPKSTKASRSPVPNRQRSGPAEPVGHGVAAATVSPRRGRGEGVPAQEAGPGARTIKMKVKNMRA